MGHERKITEIFGRCYRLMHRVGAAMDDQFFAGLWSRESDGLLSDFIVFLSSVVEIGNTRAVGASNAESNSNFHYRVEKRGELTAVQFVNHQQSDSEQKKYAPTQSVVLSKDDMARQDVVRHQNYVVQYHRRLKPRIQKILELLEIIKHVGQTDAATPLLLERELLKLRLAVMDVTGEPRAGKKSKGDTRQDFSSKNLGGPNASRNAIVDAAPKLSAVHREILEFIRSRGLSSSKVGLGEQVQNIEIFARFGNIHRRTLKRKLSDLVVAGSLARAAKGKRVYYALSGTT